MKLATTAIVFCVCALVLLGLVSVYSAGMWKDGSRYMIAQSVWVVLGLMVCAGFALMDYRILAKLIWILAPLTLLLLLLLYIPALAPDINGAHRWLKLGSITVQPSELAKLTIIIGLAAYCAANQRRLAEFKRGLLIPGAVCGVPLLLILKQPDYGTAFLLASLTGALLLVAGVRLRHLVPAAIAGLVLYSFMVMANPNKRGRIMAWLNPQEHKQGAALQADQAMLALGRGGMTGVGLGDSRQKLGFIPENHTDFIFAVIGEEFGLAGTLSILCLYTGIFAAMLAVARCAPDPFGFYLACGVAFLIGLQAFINIGVVTSVLPNKGMALPFVSYGGSSLVVMLGAVGIVLSVARRGETPAKTKSAGRKKSKEAGKTNPKTNPFSSGDPEAQFG